MQQKERFGRFAGDKIDIMFINGKWGVIKRKPSGGIVGIIETADPDAARNAINGQMALGATLEEHAEENWNRLRKLTLK